MKNTLLRIFTAALVVIMSAVSFTSCIKKYDAIYFEGANGEIVSGFNENMLSYHMSMEKTTLLYGMGITSDVPESCREQGFRGLMTKETAENIIKTAVEAAEGSVSFMFLLYFRRFLWS